MLPRILVIFFISTRGQEKNKNISSSSGTKEVWVTKEMGKKYYKKIVKYSISMKPCGVRIFELLI